MSNCTGKEDESNPHFVLHQIETLLSEKKILKITGPNKTKTSPNHDMNKNDENVETKKTIDNFDKGEPTKHFTNVKKVYQFLTVYISDCVANFGCSESITGHSKNITSAVECRKDCQQENDCRFEKDTRIVESISFRFFTWYSDGGLKNYCFGFKQCLSINLECKFCVSGPEEMICKDQAE
jgi:hypothetical protein